MSMASALILCPRGHGHYAAAGPDDGCPACVAELGGLYELVVAERHSLDADPDWAERVPYCSTGEPGLYRVDGETKTLCWHHADLRGRYGQLIERIDGPATAGGCDDR